MNELQKIPGIGSSITKDLNRLGIKNIADLEGQDPQQLFDESNRLAGCVQDRCLLYTFRCAVYYANTPAHFQETDKLKWWNWKDGKR